MTMRSAVAMGVLQTSATMMLGLASIKITSVFLGPAGLGLVGLLNYFMALVQGAVAAGVSTGVARRTTELAEDPGRRRLMLSSVTRLLVVAGFIVSVIVIVASPVLASSVLHNAAFSGPLVTFSAFFIFGLLASVLTACAIGAKDYVATAATNIGGAFVSFIVMAAMSIYFGIPGGLYAASVMPLITFGVAVLIGRRRAWWPRGLLRHGFSTSEARASLSFMPMALVASIATPLVQIMIRDNVVSAGSIADLGLLQGVNRVSDMVTGLASGLFTMYYLPRFTEIKTQQEMRRELSKGVMLIIPSMALINMTIYLSRDFIVDVLFTTEFAPMRELFAWQMAGNVLKMTGWLFAFVLLAKINPLSMAGLEMLTLLAWWGSAEILVARYAVHGAPMAYCAIYGAYCVVVIGMAWYVVRKMP